MKFKAASAVAVWGMIALLSSCTKPLITQTEDLKLVSEIQTGDSQTTETAIYSETADTTDSEKATTTAPSSKMTESATSLSTKAENQTTQICRPSETSNTAETDDAIDEAFRQYNDVKQELNGEQTVSAESTYYGLIKTDNDVVSSYSYNTVFYSKYIGLASNKPSNYGIYYTDTCNKTEAYSNGHTLYRKDNDGNITQSADQENDPIGSILLQLPDLKKDQILSVYKKDVAAFNYQINLSTEMLGTIEKNLGCPVVKVDYTKIRTYSQANEVYMDIVTEGTVNYRGKEVPFSYSGTVNVKSGLNETVKPSWVP